MFHQKIPSYDGAQPFIYAVYCKEDEALAYPVLARMYNEGFRVCCAPSTGISSDYYKQQRLQSAAGIIMFMSRQMAERLRSGDPDVLAAARSPLMRTVILLDETDVSNNIFAMAVPDHQSYIRENDSAFWLYIYSNDYFDGCRGKWPEKQLLLRDPVYEDINEEVVSEEYLRLQNIMTGTSSEKKSYDPFDADTLYQNNPGYIEPTPDEFTYEPLERIEAIRTEQDDQYDEVLGLINQAEDAMEKSRIRTAEATAAAVQAAKAAAEAAAEQEKELAKAAAEQAADTAEPVEEIPVQEEAEAELQTEPGENKADLIVTPEEAQDEPAESIAEAEKFVTEEFEVIPVTEEESAAAQLAIMASARMLREDDGVISSEIPENNDNIINENDIAAKAVQEPAPVKEASKEPEKKETRRSAVPVMVRRQSSARRTGAKKREVVRTAPTSVKAHHGNMHLSSAPAAEGKLPRSISESITFEQYVRDIARSYVNELLERPEEPAAAQPAAVPARKHRQRINVVQAAVQEVQPTIEPAAADNEPDAEELKTAQSARKNRHPHQKTGFFNAIINALRSQGKNAAEQPAAQDESDDDGDASMGAGQGDSVVADTAAETPAASEIAKSDADTVQQSSISVSIAESCLDLQSVVEKFIECNRVPSITVRPRTMVRRYRD